jgi:hypothetical protein
MTESAADIRRLRALSRDVLRYLFDFVAPMDDMTAFLDLPPPVARAAFTQLLLACGRSGELICPDASESINGQLWSFAANRGLPLALYARRYTRNLPRLAAVGPGCRITIRRAASEPSAAPLYASCAGAALHFWAAGPPRPGRIRAYPCYVGAPVDREGIKYTTVMLLSFCPLTHSTDYLAANFDIECVVENTRVLQYHDAGEVLIQVGK